MRLTVIYGPTGSGKTLLAQELVGGKAVTLSASRLTSSREMRKLIEKRPDAVIFDDATVRLLGTDLAISNLQEICSHGIEVIVVILLTDLQYLAPLMNIGADVIYVTENSAPSISAGKHSLIYTTLAVVTCTAE